MDLRSWYRWEAGGLAFYKAWNLEVSGIVTHAFTTRIGGVSDPPFDTLNLGLHVGDAPESVIENRRRCCEALELDAGKLTTVEQVHNAEVAVVRPDHVGAGARDFGAAIRGADAMITNQPGVPLATFYADCVPVFILDPVNKAIGLAHAGWKGTAANVVARTLEAMSRAYGSRPADCMAAIGPAIGRCCYEVGSKVANALWKICGDDRCIVRGPADSLRVDLPLANSRLLRAAGVPEERIAFCPLCTHCNTTDFFSYRRDGQTGRMAAVIALK